MTKSLVAAEAVGSGTRLRLLATTRTYAVEKLAEAGELDATVRREAGIPNARPTNIRSNPWPPSDPPTGRRGARLRLTRLNPLDITHEDDRPPSEGMLAEFRAGVR